MLTNILVIPREGARHLHIFSKPEMDFAATRKPESVGAAQLKQADFPRFSASARAGTALKLPAPGLAKAERCT
jgi:hypothetical protein